MRFRSNTNAVAAPVGDPGKPAGPGGSPNGEREEARSTVRLLDCLKRKA